MPNESQKWDELKQSAGTIRPPLGGGCHCGLLLLSTAAPAQGSAPPPVTRGVHILHPGSGGSCKLSAGLVLQGCHQRSRSLGGLPGSGVGRKAGLGFCWIPTPRPLPFWNFFFLEARREVVIIKSHEKKMKHLAVRQMTNARC